jgi:hypothetical protein
MAVSPNDRVWVSDGDGNPRPEAMPMLSELAALGGWVPAAHAHAYTDITGKPATFAPAAHTHAPSEVTGTAVVDADARLTHDRKPAFVTGDGGAVTQATNKSTGVTLNKRAGDITMHAAALAAGAIVTFTLTNSTITAASLVVVAHVAGGTSGPYLITARPGAGSVAISVRNTSAASLGEAIVIRFAVIPSVTA